MHQAVFWRITATLRVAPVALSLLRPPGVQIAAGLYQYDPCKSRFITVALMRIAFDCSMCSSAALSASLKHLSKSFPMSSPTQCVQWTPVLNVLTTFSCSRLFLAPVRPALGGRARQDSPGTQQGAGGLPAADVHQQWGASTRDWGMLVPSVVTVPEQVQVSDFTHILQKKCPDETLGGYWLHLRLCEAHNCPKKRKKKVKDKT